MKIRQLNTGSAGALARNAPQARIFSTFTNLNIRPYATFYIDKFSRYALNAGEGARAPSELDDAIAAVRFAKILAANASSPRPP